MIKVTNPFNNVNILCWFRIPDRFKDLFPEVMNVYLNLFALRKFSTYGTWYLPVPLLSTIKVIFLRRVHLVPVPATHCRGVAG